MRPTSSCSFPRISKSMEILKNIRFSMGQCRIGGNTGKTPPLKPKNVVEIRCYLPEVRLSEQMAEINEKPRENNEKVNFP